MINVQYYTNKLIDLNFQYYVEESALTNSYFKNESFVRNLKRNFKSTTFNVFKFEVENFVSKSRSRIFKKPCLSSNSYYSCLINDFYDSELIKNDYLRSQFKREKLKIFRELYLSIHNQINSNRELQREFE